MDKAAARTAFQAVGIQVPDGQVAPLEDAHDIYPAPYVVKPVAEGSSVGVIIVPEGGNRRQLAKIGASASKRWLSAMCRGEN